VSRYPTYPHYQGGVATKVESFACKMPYCWAG